MTANEPNDCDRVESTVGGDRSEVPPAVRERAEARWDEAEYNLADADEWGELDTLREKDTIHPERAKGDGRSPTTDFGVPWLDDNELAVGYEEDGVYVDLRAASPDRERTIRTVAYLSPDQAREIATVLFVAAEELARWRDT